MNGAEQYNLGDDVEYVNGLLNNFGLEEFPFSAIFEKEESEYKSKSIKNNYGLLESQARVCSILIQLLHSKQKEEMYRKDSEDRIMRFMEELRNLELSQKRQDDRIKLQDRELVGYKQNHQLFLEKQRQIEGVSTGLRDELTKLKQICSQKDRQFQHELRKKEKEFEKLKDQLAALLKDMTLREQKSEIQYLQKNTSVNMHVNADDFGDDSDFVTSDDNVVSHMDEDVYQNDSNNKTVDRIGFIENENYRLRQILSFSYGSLVQIILDLFPELELDQSLLSLLESNPIDWIDQQLTQKIEELFEILRNNLEGITEMSTSSNLTIKEHEETINRLSVTNQSLTSTISSQNETIRSLELKLAKMDEFTREQGIKKATSLDEQSCQASSELIIDNNSVIPNTPKWMKNK